MTTTQPTSLHHITGGIPLGEIRAIMMSTNTTTTYHFAPIRLEAGQDTDLSPSPGRFPYWVDIHDGWNARIRLRKKILDWYQEQGSWPVTHFFTGGADRYFFRTAQDQTLFLLKWR